MRGRPRPEEPGPGLRPSQVEDAGQPGEVGVAAAGRTGYGRALIRAAEGARTQLPLPGLVGMADHRNHLRRRISRDLVWIDGYFITWPQAAAGG